MAEIPDDVDLAVVNVNAAVVPGLIDEIGAKGIKYALVFTSGFSEVGPEGAAIERDLGERAKQLGHPRVRSQHQHQCLRTDA